MAENFEDSERERRADWRAQEAMRISLPDRVLTLELKFDFISQKLEAMQKTQVASQASTQWWLRWLTTAVASAVIVLVVQFVFSGGMSLIKAVPK